MAGNWAKVPLGGAITLQRGFDLPSQDRKYGNVPIVSSSGISGYHCDVGVKGPGVVTGRYGTIGQVFLIKEDFWPLNTTLWVKDFQGNDPRFASYLLRTVDFQSCSDKSSVPGVNRNDLHRIPVVLPPLAEQLAIAEVLGTLDDKIELNRRMNATLEQLARALFQSWFVDFDPVRANFDSRDTARLDAATLALFPKSLQESAVGKIPEGWSVLPADRIASIGIGRTPPRMERHWFSENSEDIPWISIRDLGNSGAFVSKTAEFLTPDAAERFRVKRIPNHTVLLSFKLTMGRVAITDGEMLSNEAIAHFRLNEEATFGPTFLYCYLKGFDYSRLGNTSSIATAINSDTIRTMPILVPTRQVAESFELIVAPLFSQIKNLLRECETLVTLRDALLPKLLSGELRIPDAERLVSEK